MITRPTLKAAFLAIFCCLLAGTPGHAADPASGKLVINSAVWGDLDNDKTSDVTAKVAAMVKDNSLSVAATSENLGEPAAGQPKKLKVDYLFDGNRKSKTVAENDTLTISD